MQMRGVAPSTIPVLTAATMWHTFNTTHGISPQHAHPPPQSNTGQTMGQQRLFTAPPTPPDTQGW
eukprot:13445-Eustigmatos_ZCMA.PRE.1